MAGSLFTKILVPVDFSPCSEEAFRVALTLAKTFHALLLLHVIDTSAWRPSISWGYWQCPQTRRVRSGGCAIMRDSMCGNCSNQSRPRA